MRNLKHLPLLLLAFAFMAGLALMAYKHHFSQDIQNETMARGGMENMGVFLRSI